MLGVAGFAGFSQHKYGSMSETLDAHIATYKRQRWDRRVHRGAAKDDNAAQATWEALAGMAPLSAEQREQLASQLHYGQPLKEEQAALIKERAAHLAKLRAATRSAWSMTVLPAEQGDGIKVPDYALFIDSVLLLLADGVARGPDDCLAVAADVVRLGQDLVPGAPLEAASISMRATSIAAPVITRCAQQADADALLRTARELRGMATNPPPVGGGIELADIVAMVQLRKLADIFSDEGDETLLVRLRRRPAIYAAWQHFDRPTRWRELSAVEYPDSLETWRREHEWRSRAGLMLVGDATGGVVGWLYDDMRGQALLRILTVGLATLGERARYGRLPSEPAGLGDRALRDPYNGQALHWRLSQDADELSIWSVGEDRRDDKGARDWADQAPIDVVVHFALVSTKPEPKKADRRRRHSRKK